MGIIALKYRLVSNINEIATEIMEEIKASHEPSFKKVQYGNHEAIPNSQNLSVSLRKINNKIKPKFQRVDIDITDYRGRVSDTMARFKNLDAAIDGHRARTETQGQYYTLADEKLQKSVAEAVFEVEKERLKCKRKIATELLKIVEKEYKELLSKAQNNYDDLRTCLDAGSKNIKNFQHNIDDASSSRFEENSKNDIADYNSVEKAERFVESLEGDSPVANPGLYGEISDSISKLKCKIGGFFIFTKSWVILMNLLAFKTRSEKIMQSGDEEENFIDELYKHLVTNVDKALADLFTLEAKFRVEETQQYRLAEIKEKIKGSRKEVECLLLGGLVKKITKWLSDPGDSNLMPASSIRTELHEALKEIDSIKIFSESLKMVEKVKKVLHVKVDGEIHKLCTHIEESKKRAEDKYDTFTSIDEGELDVGPMHEARLITEFILSMVGEKRCMSSKIKAFTKAGNNVVETMLNFIEEVYDFYAKADDLKEETGGGDSENKQTDTDYLKNERLKNGKVRKTVNELK